MANKFTPTDSFYLGFNSGRDTVIEGNFVVDTAVGATAGTLLATQFGLNKLTEPVYFTASDDSASFIGVPSYDRKSLIVKIFSGNTGVNLPNGTYSCRVTGN